VLLSKDQILASDNILALHFASAKKNALELERVHGSVRAGSTNLGHPSRVYVRKAQYDWRWDWGPELMTAGPYRPISLRTYTARITDVDAHAAVSEILAPSLQVGISVAGTISAAHFARIHLMTFDGATVREETVRVDSKTKLDHLLRWDLQSQVDLWWPIGYGSQARYTVEVSLLTSDGSILDSQRKTIGFRRVLLVQEPLNDADQYGKGKTFLFEVNNIRIFIGGANWVPADNFLTTVSATRLRAWLNLLRDGNMNMVRLWGGGVYEPDLFYDICDGMCILFLI
jgi:beta-mannosidase